MGTRGLTKVIDNTGKVVVAQYGQWDHYPSGQGVNLLSFLRVDEGRSRQILDPLESALNKCYFVDENTVDSFTAPHGEKWEVFYPQFSRNTGTDILKVVLYSSGTVPLLDSSNFETDGLFCEGVFTLDFQKRKFISKCNSKLVEFDFENLPKKDEYLSSFSSNS